MGELHLDIIVDRMRREFKVEANVGAPQVAYRETITRLTEKDYTHKKQTGGTGQFARVKLVFEPNPDGEDFKFESKIVGGAVPKEYIPGVRRASKAFCPLVRWPASRCWASRRPSSTAPSTMWTPRFWPSKSPRAPASVKHRVKPAPSFWSR